jgi:NADH:ubiquinone oxidoreductase subunit E
MRWAEEIPREEWEKIDQVIDKYRERHGVLIPVLKEAQDICGYLPKKVQRRIAEGLRLPASQVYGVVSFYSFFTVTPRGRHTIRVCMGTACYVRGGQTILDFLRKELNVEVNSTTPDLRYTLEVINCPGTCGLAPVICVDEDVYGIPDNSKALDVLKEYP